MKYELRWRAYWGYGDSEYLKIGIDDLARVKYAMQTGSIVDCNSIQVDGKRIWRLEPDVRYYTGWHDSYKYGSGDDEREMRLYMPEARRFREAERRATLLADVAKNKGIAHLSVSLIKEGETEATIALLDGGGKMQERIQAIIKKA